MENESKKKITKTKTIIYYYPIEWVEFFQDPFVKSHFNVYI